MHRTRLALAGIVLLVVAAPAWGADFSGSYTADFGNNVTLSIQHTGDTLNITHTRTDREGQNRVSSFTYTADGTSRSTGSVTGANRSASAQWQDENTLEVRYQQGQSQIIETWRLAGDSLTLEISRGFSDRASGMTRTMTFNR